VTTTLHTRPADAGPAEHRLRLIARALDRDDLETARELAGMPLGAPQLALVASDLTAREAATILGLTRPDGSPRDSFYKITRELGGYRNTGGSWMFTEAGINRFKEGGGRRCS
jgi:hypothetical protein